MPKIVAMFAIGLLVLLIINGARLTFFPATACGLARKNQAIPLSQSVAEFRREQEKRYVARTQQK